MTDTAIAEIGHNHPPRAKTRYPATTCPECSGRFRPEHHRQHFCTPEHKRAYSQRLLGEGQRIVGLAKAWRMSRNGHAPELKAAGREAFSMMCRELDALNARDKEAGRMSALRVFYRRVKNGLMDFQGAVNRR
ncbi:hypothetical protein UFOVP1324_56 [uncultured Caudovirales phage]|uniref:Uncharacterized protein n=1 Tax=uncultured Caudovirales phage TaxID=2100421 RepID=A0A6J5RNZ3_9CAUD|nr:hypothetical protein UFOVP1324_56 [uncultured Caudovirales phage]